MAGQGMRGANFVDFRKKPGYVPRVQPNRTPKEVRENIFIYVLRILAADRKWQDIRNHYGVQLGVFYNPSDAEKNSLKQILMPILREYIPNNMVVNTKDYNIGIIILRNAQGDWLPQEVSQAMNKEIQQATKQFLIKLFKKGKSPDGKWSIRRESAIRTLQNSPGRYLASEKAYKPGNPGEKAAQRSHTAAEAKAAQRSHAAAEANQSSSQGETKGSQGAAKENVRKCAGGGDCWKGEESKKMCLSYNMNPDTKKSRCAWTGGRRRKKTRRKKRKSRKRKSHRRRKSKKRKIKRRRKK